MRVALISFFPEQNQKNASILTKLVNASASKGNQVELFNGFDNLTNTRLTAFDYIAVIVRTKGLWGGKIPPRVREYLATSGNISGKKGCALVIKGGISSDKTCKNLMRAMESEGVKLDYFDVLQNEESVPSVGKKIG